MCDSIWKEDKSKLVWILKCNSKCLSTFNCLDLWGNYIGERNTYSQKNNYRIKVCFVDVERIQNNYWIKINRKDIKNLSRTSVYVIFSKQNTKLLQYFGWIRCDSLNNKLYVKISQLNRSMHLPNYDICIPKKIKEDTLRKDLFLLLCHPSRIISEDLVTLWNNSNFRLFFSGFIYEIDSCNMKRLELEAFVPHLILIVKLYPQLMKIIFSKILQKLFTIWCNSDCYVKEMTDILVETFPTIWKKEEQELFTIFSIFIGSKQPLKQHNSKRYLFKVKLNSDILLYFILYRWKAYILEENNSSIPSSEIIKRECRTIEIIHRRIKVNQDITHHDSLQYHKFFNVYNNESSSRIVTPCIHRLKMRLQQKVREAGTDMFHLHNEEKMLYINYTLTKCGIGDDSLDLTDETRSNLANELIEEFVSSIEEDVQNNGYSHSKTHQLKVEIEKKIRDNKKYMPRGCASLESLGLCPATKENSTLDICRDLNLDIEDLVVFQQEYDRGNSCDRCGILSHIINKTTNPIIIENTNNCNPCGVQSKIQSQF
jgi:hypothetical protein